MFSTKHHQAHTMTPPIKFITYCRHDPVEAVYSAKEVQEITQRFVQKITPKVSKSTKRLKHAEDTICKFLLSRKNEAKIQLRNVYEYHKLAEFIAELGEPLAYELRTDGKQYKVAEMIVRLPNDDGCAACECSCARYRVWIKRQEYPVYYLVLMQKKNEFRPVQI
jgi:hypothetical protein